MTQHNGCQQYRFRSHFFRGEENDAVYDVDGNPAHRIKYDDVGQADGTAHLAPLLLCALIICHHLTFQASLLLADYVKNIQVDHQHEGER